MFVLMLVLSLSQNNIFKSQQETYMSNNLLLFIFKGKKNKNLNYQGRFVFNVK